MVGSLGPLPRRAGHPQLRWYRCALRDPVEYLRGRVHRGARDDDLGRQRDRALSDHTPSNDASTRGANTSSARYARYCFISALAAFSGAKARLSRDLDADNVDIPVMRSSRCRMFPIAVRLTVPPVCTIAPPTTACSTRRHSRRAAAMQIGILQTPVLVRGSWNRRRRQELPLLIGAAVRRPL